MSRGQWPTWSVVLLAVVVLTHLLSHSVAPPEQDARAVVGVISPDPGHGHQNRLDHPDIFPFVPPANAPILAAPQLLGLDEGSPDLDPPVMRWVVPIGHRARAVHTHTLEVHLA